jgi:hypothetical protein
MRANLASDPERIAKKAANEAEYQKQQSLQAQLEKELEEATANQKSNSILR